MPHRTEQQGDERHMLYDAYQAQRDALAPWRFFAETARGMIEQSGPIIGNLPLVRGNRGGVEFAVAHRDLARAGALRHQQRDDRRRRCYGQRRNRPPPIRSCRLVHFRKAAALDQPKLLMVAPLSGHFATLLRGTVATALPDHDVYLTDWINARNVPVRDGSFGLDDVVGLVTDFIRLLGPGAHVMAVCQTSVPVLAAVSLLAMAKDPCQPASMVLMGGPIDPAANPTEVNRFAETHSLGWFESTVITTVRRAITVRSGGLSRISAARRLSQHEPRQPSFGALADVPAAGRGRR